MQARSATAVDRAPADPSHRPAFRGKLSGMIVSASYRTDIPALYARWFLQRLAAGEVQVANPYGRKPYTVALRRSEVSGFVFWTRNIGPLLDDLPSIAAIAPFVVQFTVTGYPRVLEPGVIGAEVAVDQIRAVANRFGPRAVVWRYDPILDTSLTPLAGHRETFARLADALAGSVDEVVVSFTQIYAKTRRNLEAAARRHAFSWREPEDSQKSALIDDIAGTAATHGIELRVCTQPDLVAAGATPARCIDAARLSDLAGRTITARTKGNRPGCLCHESRDIGAYDTCPQGCVYCYAVANRAVAKRNLAAHDANAGSLAPRR